MGPCPSLTWAGPQVQPPSGCPGGFSPLLHTGQTASALGLGGAEDRGGGTGAAETQGRGVALPLPQPLPDTWPRRAPTPGSPIPEALGAEARVAIDRVHALGPVAAPVGHAVIVVHLAELPAVAGETLAPGHRERGCSTPPAPMAAGTAPPLRLRTVRAHSPPDPAHGHQGQPRGATEAGA